MRKITEIKKIKPPIKFYIKYTKEGRLKGIIQSKNEYRVSEKDWLKGVSCFVLNEKGEILLEQRANTDLTPHAIDLCSGHIDGAESPMQAMYRELKEELGLDPGDLGGKLKKINTKAFPLVFVSGNKKRNFLINFFCIKLTYSQVDKIIKQEEEVADFIWKPAGEVFEMIQKGKTKFPKGDKYRRNI